MIPPDANAAFVAAMEDVLETYLKPRDPERTLVCLDETSKQLVIETRKPIPVMPGKPIRYEYAQVLKELSDTHFPDAKQIVLVQDNLSTHTAASLYAAFRPDEARRMPSDSSGITRPNTEAGSTWPNPNSPF